MTAGRLEAAPAVRAAIQVLPAQWPAIAGVHAFTTLRGGGLSKPPFAGLNLREGQGDDPVAVRGNRALLRSLLPSDPVPLNQVHGVAVWDADAPHTSGEMPTADAAVSLHRGTVLEIQTADCLPVLIADRKARAVGAAHAGWRGLAAGVIEATLDALQARVPDGEWQVWLGPAIGPRAFEVGAEVRDAFVAQDPAAEAAFLPGAPGKYLADIYLLARQRLAARGISVVHGGGLCTVSDAERFFSYRRDRVTGRMASLIWLA
jgi:YfiH family protein